MRQQHKSWLLRSWREHLHLPNHIEQHDESSTEVKKICGTRISLLMEIVHFCRENSSFYVICRPFTIYSQCGADSGRPTLTCTQLYTVMADLCPPVMMDLHPPIMMDLCPCVMTGLCLFP